MALGSFLHQGKALTNTVSGGGICLKVMTRIYSNPRSLVSQTAKLLSRKKSSLGKRDENSNLVHSLPVIVNLVYFSMVTDHSF